MKMKNILKILFGTVLAAPLLASAETLLFQKAEPVAQNKFEVLEASPDGKALFVLRSSTPAGIEIFSVVSDGSLQSTFPLNTTLAGIEGASSMAFSPAADVVLVGNDSAGIGTPPGTGRFGLYAFSRGTTGRGFDAMLFVNSNGGAAEAGLFDDINVTAVTVSADSKNIYVTGTLIAGGEGVVAVLGGIKYLASSNRIEYTPLVLGARIKESDSAALSVLDVPVDIAILDSHGVYVISDSTVAGQDAFIHFARDLETGTLSLNSSANTATGASKLDGPSDLLVATIGNVVNIFVAAAGSSSIIQFEQANKDLAPALKQVYGTDSIPSVTGLTGVSRLILNSSSNIMYAAATGLSSIESFTISATDRVLTKIKNTTAITQGAKTSNGVVINGITNVNLFALGSAGENISDEYLYSGSSISASSSVAKFSRQSNLSTTVRSLSGTVTQPGQVAGFSIVVTNNGPTDAPFFELRLSPSHSVSSISGADAGSCTTRALSGTNAIVCNKDALDVSEQFIVSVVMRPTVITTAGVSALALSGNQISSSAAAAASASDSIKVGEFKNGTLAVGVLAHLLLLLIYVVRRYRH